MTPKKIICTKCKHFESGILGCKAFPDGIPNLIKSGKDNHTTPLPEQKNDIVFERLKKI